MKRIAFEHYEESGQASLWRLAFRMNTKELPESQRPIVLVHWFDDRQEAEDMASNVAANPERTFLSLDCYCRMPGA